MSHISHFGKLVISIHIVLSVAELDKTDHHMRVGVKDGRAYLLMLKCEVQNRRPVP